MLAAACSSGGDLLSDSTTTGSTSPAPQAAAFRPGGTTPDMAQAQGSEPIVKLYNKGLASLKSGSYSTAAKQFAEVERQHPYSSWATRAILMQAYAQYQRNSYDDSIVAAKRFITLHPGHQDTAYAYYLVALSYYEQIADVKRDQSNTENALAALDEVARRFPGSPYAADSQAKAVLARDHLAGKEMEIGRYYLKRAAYLAAINRFKTVVTTYQTTSHVPEALYRLTESYLSLGVVAEAQTAAAVLGHNFPNSDWYQDAYRLLAEGGLAPVKNEESWISKAVTSVNPF